MPATDPSALTSHASLIEVLDRARRLGFTGDAPPQDHIAHALQFLAAIETLDQSGAGEADGASSAPRGLVGVDLGSGAGLPGLVLALALPQSSWVLVEAMSRRAGPLTEAISRLDLADRVEVWQGRAEEYAQEPGRRGVADVVTARGFAAPAATAECAAPLLRSRGLLVVSEPPSSDGSRWPVDGLSQFGLAPQRVVEGVMVCASVAPCPSTFPRRVGVPAKRPLF